MALKVTCLFKLNNVRGDIIILLSTFHLLIQKSHSLKHNLKASNEVDFKAWIYESQNSSILFIIPVQPITL